MRIHHRHRSQAGGAVAWLALLIALAALGLAWIAVERTGGLPELPGSPGAERESASAPSQAPRGSLSALATEKARAAWTTARRELASVEEHLAAWSAEGRAGSSAVYRQALDEVGRLRAAAAKAAAGGGAAARDAWRDLDVDLAEVETKLRAGAADAFDTLNRALARARERLAEAAADE